MADDAPVVGWSVVGAGGDQHVPAVPVRVGDDPGVAEGLVVPLPVGELLVPARIGLKERVVRVPPPGQQVVGGGVADPLDVSGRV